MRRSVIVAGIIFALLVITQAQASAQTGVIYGCVNSRSGALRIVSGHGECGSKETAIYWNQAGSLGVYDGNNLYLGHLVTFNNQTERRTDSPG